MHECEALVISCIDFRFQEHLKQFLNRKHFQNYDLVSVAGSAKNLVASKQSSEFLLNQVLISYNLHRVKNIYIINHQNCGAYGPSLVSGSLQEKTTHRRDLEKARQLIKRKLPSLKVKLYFMNFKKNPLEKVYFTEIK